MRKILIISSISLLVFVIILNFVLLEKEKGKNSFFSKASSQISSQFAKIPNLFKKSKKSDETEIKPEKDLSKTQKKSYIPPQTSTQIAKSQPKNTTLKNQPTTETAQEPKYQRVRMPNLSEILLPTYVRNEPEQQTNYRYSRPRYYPRMSYWNSWWYNNYPLCSSIPWLLPTSFGLWGYSYGWNNYYSYYAEQEEVYDGDIVTKRQLSQQAVIRNSRRTQSNFNNATGTTGTTMTTSGRQTITTYPSRQGSFQRSPTPTRTPQMNRVPVRSNTRTRVKKR